MAIGGSVEVDLPLGWISLIATGDLTEHPGCEETEGEQPRYSEVWRAQQDIWVNTDDPPVGRPVHILPDVRDRRVVLTLLPSCDCCLD